MTVNLATFSFFDKLPNLSTAAIQNGLAGFGIENAEIDLSNQDARLQIRINTNLYAITPNNHPLPKEIWQPLADKSGHFPNAGETLRQHVAHSVISLLSVKDDTYEARLDLAMQLTALTSVWCSKNALAIIWYPAEKVLKASAFSGFAKATYQSPADSYDHYPWPLWCTISTAPSSMEITVLTTGLLPILGRELEVTSTRAQTHIAAQQLQRLIAYLIKNGPVIEDGDTAGVTAEIEILVRHKLSPHRKDTPIYELTLHPRV